MPVQRRDRPRFAEAEAVEVERKALLRGVVDLVRDQQDGFARAAKDVGDLLVPGRHARARVDHEEHEVGRAHGLLRLRCDGLRHRRLVGDVDTARVDEKEPPSVPLADQLLAIARHARCLVHDGRA